jgi:hypothetical protein
VGQQGGGQQYLSPGLTNENLVTLFVEVCARGCPVPGRGRGRAAGPGALHWGRLLAGQRCWRSVGQGPGPAPGSWPGALCSAAAPALPAGSWQQGASLASGLLRCCRCCGRPRRAPAKVLPTRLLRYAPAGSLPQVDGDLPEHQHPPQQSQDDAEMIKVGGWRGWLAGGEGKGCLVVPPSL